MRPRWWPGLIGSDDYTEQMRMDRRGGRGPRGGGDDGRAGILADWGDDTLKTAIRSGGYRGGEDVAGEVDAVRPARTSRQGAEQWSTPSFPRRRAST